MSENIDYQHQDQKRLKHAFVPTLAEVLTLLLFSALFLVVVNSFQYIKSSDAANYSQATEIIEAKVRDGLGYVDTLLGSTIPLVIFWMVIGVFAYLMSWLAYRAYVAYKSDMPFTKGMVVPKGYSQSKLLHESIARIAVRIISVVILCYWTYFYLTTVLTSTSDRFLESIMNVQIESLVGIWVSIITLAGSTFLIFVLARCVVMRERVFTN